jgi:predicted dehydrogenase
MAKKLAFLGCAHIHTPGFIKRIKDRTDVIVKWVWDHDMSRANLRASELGAQANKDLRAILADDDIEAMVICAETNRHEDLVMAAAQAGKHMFVEKPLGDTGAAAYRMADAIENAGVIFQTGYFQRGNPIHIFLRDQILAGAFGKITRFRHVNCHNGALGRWFDTDWRWMTDVNQAGVGAFGDLGTHSLDVMLWMLGNPMPTHVTANVDWALGNYPCDEFGEGVMKFGESAGNANRALGTVVAGWVDMRGLVSLEISGTEGHAYVVEDKLYFRSKHVAGATGESAWGELPAKLPHAFELFLDAVVGKANVPVVGAREAADRSAIMEAFYLAARNRTWIEVNA